MTGDQQSVVSQRWFISALWVFVALCTVWLILVIWPDWLVHLLGRKKVFVNALLNGVTLGALYFLVASGFTLIFGLMRNVNLAHGSLYLAGAYIGFEVSRFTGSWVLAFPVAFIAMALLGVLLQVFVFRHLDGQDLQQTLITIGISIVLADLMLWKWGGQFYQIYAPDWLSGPVETFIQSSISKRTGEPIYIKYPAVRLFILMCAIFIGLGMWYVLNKSKLGMLIRAGVDDREMLAASGVRIQLIFVGVFAFGAGLAGIAGVVGGTFQSIAPGEDTRFLLSSLVVVIVGGMGSIPGAALGAVLIGCAEQFGSVYAPTYSIVLTFVIMVVVLAFRPQGLLGRN
ncbi:MAG: ABC transporter ATP-binding protein [Marinovum sp.]|jgi:branched-chain amino acid transport system permease protein|nr:ABC transporter ATP-binding protein [Marinovum sp.]|tara:strand:+ start:300 stop:1325 length:1026 start_codon:yes stop_codon:yes gene_type:complete